MLSRILNAQTLLRNRFILRLVFGAKREGLRLGRMWLE